MGQADSLYKIERSLLFLAEKVEAVEKALKEVGVVERLALTETLRMIKWQATLQTDFVKKLKRYFSDQAKLLIRILGILESKGSVSLDMLKKKYKEIINSIRVFIEQFNRNTPIILSLRKALIQRLNREGGDILNQTLTGFGLIALGVIMSLPAALVWQKYGLFNETYMLTQEWFQHYWVITGGLNFTIIGGVALTGITKIFVQSMNFARLASK